MGKKVIVLSSLVILTILLLSCQKKVTTDMDDFVKQNQSDIQNSIETLINPSEKGLTYTVGFSDATYHQPQLKYPNPYL